MLLGIGIILLVLLIAALAYVIVGMPDGTVQIEGFLFDVEVTPLYLFLLGAAASLLLVLAIALTTLGARRYRAKQKELHELRRIADSKGESRRQTSDQPRRHTADEPRSQTTDEPRRPHQPASPAAAKDRQRRPEADRPVDGDPHRSGDQERQWRPEDDRGTHGAQPGATAEGRPERRDWPGSSADQR